MIISEIINTGSKILKNKNIRSHMIDSEIILSKVLNKKREFVLTSENYKISKKQIKKFNTLLKRRLNNEPMAYIFNRKEFWNTSFFINKNTLIPRPETELIVEKLVHIFQNKSPFIIDVGTGSGCILISLLEELKFAKGIGIDISRKALEIAIKNAKKSKAKKRMKFINRSISDSIDNKFDLIVSNPPYICSHQLTSLSNDIKNYEPKIALNGGKDGLDVIKKVIYKARNILKFNGMLALEIGNGQYRKVSQILKSNKFREKFLIKDYKENIRCILSVIN
jgi:release factor glutamine methyltransferase